MVCLAMLTGSGLTGCMQSASVPASPTQRSKRPVRQVPHSVHIGSDIQQASAEAAPSNDLSATRLASTVSLSSSNPWKPAAKPRTWKYIVLHHTASDAGSVKSIHEAHRRRKDAAGNPWLGIGYHFVIGNGNGMKDGAIEPTFRWQKQIHGAHAGVSEYNERGIGIVLVGNFEKHRPTAAQLKSARRLVKTLRTNYRIDAKNIVTHGDIKKTACPGRYFSLARITGIDERPVIGSASSANDLPLTFADRREVP